MTPGDKEKQLREVNLLGLTPVRIADWEVRGDRVVVIRPKPRVRGLRSALEWVSYQMAARKIRLDEVGSFVWLEMNGRRTVEELGRRLSERFGEKVEPVEERLGTLVLAMRREEFVGYRGWDDRKLVREGRPLHTDG
jgi:hypothetical protein